MDTLYSPPPNRRLRQERIQRNWRQRDLANLLGITPVTVSRWERGSQQPSPYFREKLCALFGKKTEELGLVSEKPDLTSVSPEDTSLWNVPFSRNHFFAGRERILTHLHVLLANEPTRATLTRACSLHGLGGIGKTQLAIEYAFRFRHEYDAILWVEAETRASLTSSFVALAGLLALPEQAEEDQNKVVAAVRRWFNEHLGWLLIFDNVEDLSLLPSFLPTSDRGALLLTTSLQTLGTLAQRIELAPMTMQEGCDFLLARAHRLRQGKERQAVEGQEMATAQQIVTQMGGLPLALEQASAYIEAARCSLSDYLYLFQTTAQRLLDEHEASRDHPLSVSRTFLLAFGRVEHRSAAAADLLTACAFLAPEAIPEAFFLEGASSLGTTFEALASDRLAFEEALKVLLSYSLIQRDASMHTLSIHRLGQVVLKERLSLAERQNWAGRVTRTMTRLFPFDEDMQTDYWRTCEQLLSHALVCLSRSEQESEQELTLALMSHVATYLTKHTRYAEAEPLLVRATQEGERILGPQHPLVAEVLNGSGYFYYEQGKYEQAEPLLKRAWHIWEQALGPEHLQLAYPLNGLANLYREQGQHDQAESLYRRTLSLRQQHLGPLHPDIAETLHDLARHKQMQHRMTEALLLYQQALAIREQSLGPHHPQTLETKKVLLDCFEQQG